MPTDQLVDTIVFLTLNALQIALLSYVFLRDRRAKRRAKLGGYQEGTAS